MKHQISAESKQLCGKDSGYFTSTTDTKGLSSALDDIYIVNRTYFSNTS